MTVKIVRLALAAILFVVCGSAVQAQGQNLNGVAVVLLHDKGAVPGARLTPLAGALRTAGAVVLQPEMPWSYSRQYDVSYGQAIAEINRAVSRVRAQGAIKVVVAGHGYGAAAAIGYAARHGGLAGVIAIAPAYGSELTQARKKGTEGIRKAKQLVAEGKGDVRTALPDIGGGRAADIQVTPKIYLSWFDPGGRAQLPKNTAAMKSAALLWVGARQDTSFKGGRLYAFDQSPAHPKNKYIEMDTGRANAPDIAKDEILAWLKSL